MRNSSTQGNTLSFAADITIIVYDKSFEDTYIHAYDSLVSITYKYNAKKLSLNLNKANHMSN